MTHSHVKLINGTAASGNNYSPASSASFRSYRHRHSASRVSTISSSSSATAVHPLPPSSFSTLPHSTFLNSSPMEPIQNSTTSSAPVSISLLVNEMLVYIRELQASSAVSLQSPFSGSRSKASLIRVLGRIRDTVTAGIGSSSEHSRWSACWNEEDSALYWAMVKALERMVGGRRGGVTDAHLIGVLKAKCPPLPRAAKRTGTAGGLDEIMEEE